MSYRGRGEAVSKNQKYLIALAGLFHDIGKFYQRATNEKISERERKPFEYAHAFLTFKVLFNELLEGLSSVFEEDEISIISEGAFHHKPHNNLQYLLQKADWISSSERKDIKTHYDTEWLSEKDKDKFIKFANNNPRLRSIFEDLDLEKPGVEYQKKNYSYKISPLSLNDSIFPLDLEDVYLDIQNKSKNIDDLLGSYKTHWNSFKQEFNQKLKTSNIKFSKHPEKVFSIIYHILYKYLWCIPASTYDKENYSSHYPDISLFDHSRILSAVACCFYDYYPNGFQQKSIEKFKNELNKEKVFLHIKADISGIQKFIYNVHSGEGGVAKTLRGRSFYVTLLPEVISRYILNELGYPISNLLYSGGGIFEVLVANTEINNKKLNEIFRKIEEFLAKKFEADLGIAFGIYKYSPVEMMTDYRNILNQLNENLDNIKKRKFQRLIETGDIFRFLNFNSKNIENKKKCSVCQTYLINEDDTICDLCNTFVNIGSFLPKTTKLVFAKEEIDNLKNSNKLIDFEDFGKIYLILEKDKIDLLKYDEKIIEILNLNDTDLTGNATGFKFLGKTVPKAIRDLPPHESEEEETIEKNQIVPFTILANLSEGDSRIGILRMDVDNLGKLFSDGIKNITISRIATLSRMFDLFFSGYINKICDSLSNLYPNDKTNSLFYILYSGGDDLFIVAPWDKTIELASKINDEFKKYTCFNPYITISAGYIQTKPKFPIKVSAEIAGEAEKKAKDTDENKNKACILGDILKWDELDEAIDQAEKIKKLIQKNKINRGFIYSIHKLKEQFLKDKNSNKNNRIIFPYKDEPDSMFFPFTHYFIARNIEDKDIAKELAKLLINTENRTHFKRLTFLINYVALKTRN